MRIKATGYDQHYVCSILTWNSENHFNYSFTHCQATLISCTGAFDDIPSFIQLIQIKKDTSPHQKKLKILFSFFCCDPVLLLFSDKAKSPLHLQETFNAYINLREAHIGPKEEYIKPQGVYIMPQEAYIKPHETYVHYVMRISSLT